MEHRQPRGRYRGRRRVPASSRRRYAAVVTSAFVGAGVVALVTGTVMPDMPEPDNLALVDATAAAQAADRAQSADRASRSEGRGAGLTAEQAAPDLYVLPLREYTLTSRFGERWERLHAGIDLAAPSGTPIHSIARGKVILARNNAGYGKCVMVDHGGGIVSLYGHMSRINVTEGQVIEAGDVIGAVGNTGFSTGDHLHLEVHVDGVEHYPIDYLKGKGADVPGKTDALTVTQ